MYPDSSASLISLLESKPLPWLYYDYERRKFIMIVDNHLLSTYRNCPQHFMHAHVEGIRKKAIIKTGATAISRVWFLEFGICLHEILEIYYQNFRMKAFDPIDFCSKQAAAVWTEHKMDEFSEEDEYKAIGGKMGFMALAAQYAVVMSPENERLRVIATEISFGKRKEVLIYADEGLEVYLAGRIDILVDDGYFICPLDHKSKAYFGKTDLSLEHVTDEAPIGYVCALKTILPKFVPEDQLLKRDCSKILMNYISKKVTATPQERFKRIPLRITEWQLQQYRMRTANTATKLLADMKQYALSGFAMRNAASCHNWFRRTCSYFDVCRQGSRDGELVTIKNGYSMQQIWDTEEV